MSTHFETLIEQLKNNPRRWFVTGAAGFIGSHLVENLLRWGQQVTGLDNFSNGYKQNLIELRALLPAEAWSRLHFVEGDIRELGTCRELCTKTDIVLHHAALGSVPRSIKDPINSNDSNVNGFLNILVAAKDAGVKRVVFASSSSVYGDNTDLPKVEERTGQPLSPYAVTKVANELYGRVFASTYGMSVIGLRYFNVFGARQSPNGPYAAVIPKWIEAMLHGDPVYINGDGETSRDFCYVRNVVQMNVLAGTTTKAEADGQIFNTALDARTSLNQLFGHLNERLQARVPGFKAREAVYRETRAGDIAHSQASIVAGRKVLAYDPRYDIRAGLDEALDWYIRAFSK